MRRFFTAFAALSFAACAASAQETATTTEEATSEATEATAQAQETAGGLSLGTVEEAALGETYVQETIGDWRMQCVKTENEVDPCQMYQLLKDEQGNSVAEVTLFRLDNGGQAVAGATVIVPLETLLTAQLNIAVDGGQGKRYPFAFCNQIGCYARVGLTAEDVAAYKAGNVAQVVLVPVAAPDQRVILQMSLSGFTASYDKVTIIEPPA